MDKESLLIEKLQRIERLHEGSSTEGERVAAEEAHNRVRERLRLLQEENPPVEYTFHFADSWRRRLFSALVRRYNLSPYRYRGQRYTTVMVEVSKTFVDEILWPEYLALEEALVSHLDEITRRVIHHAVHCDSSEAQERESLPG
jgi:hypothetical protein